jgi:hypothetical protein
MLRFRLGSMAEGQTRRSILVLLAALCVPAVAAAQQPPGEDYSPNERAWNGLSDFAALARAEGLEVVATHQLDWQELRPSDVVFLLYPTAYVDASHVATFLRAGGRILIADDFGRGDEALSRLGILRRAPGPESLRAYQDNPNLPIARPIMSAHPLASGIDELHTNHPMVFSVAAGPDEVFALGKETLVVAGTLGNAGGRFVALADPSVFINAMLAWGGNLQFALNTLSFLRPEGGTGRILVLTGDVELRGAPIGPKEEDGTFDGILAAVEEALQEINDYVGHPEALRGVGYVLALALVVIGALWVPLSRRAEPDGAFTRLGDEGPVYDRLVADYDTERGDRNFALPAAILRELAEAKLPAKGHDRLKKDLSRLPRRADVIGASVHVSPAVFLDLKQRVADALGDARRD